MEGRMKKTVFPKTVRKLVQSCDSQNEIVSVIMKLYNAEVTL